MSPAGPQHYWGEGWGQPGLHGLPLDKRIPKTKNGSICQVRTAFHRAPEPGAELVSDLDQSQPAVPKLRGPGSVPAGLGSRPYLNVSVPGAHPAWRPSQVEPCGLWSLGELVGGLGCHNLGDKGFLRGHTHTQNCPFFFFFNGWGQPGPLGSEDTALGPCGNGPGRAGVVRNRNLQMGCDRGQLGPRASQVWKGWCRLRAVIPALGTEQEGCREFLV